MTDYAIETVGLDKVYKSWMRPNRDIHALNGVDLRVPRGSKFGLLGANGAGKTTFVKILVSAVFASSGSATLFGRDVREPEARRPVGYLPENHRFPTYFTGTGMLDFYAALSGVDEGDRRRRIPELLDLVGLKDWGSVRIKKYSKGMLQRLGLAQALIHKPQLLLLDEPTDGVDPVGRRDIRNILNSLTGTGVTVFVNSHLLSEVEAFCEHVAILKRGKLALEGRISDLVSGRGYRIIAAGLSEDAINALAVFATSAVRTAEGSVEIRVSTREDSNRAIDVIRSGNALVESVTSSSSTLEDVFIETTAAKVGAA